MMMIRLFSWLIGVFMNDLLIVIYYGQPVTLNIILKFPLAFCCSFTQCFTKMFTFAFM